MWVYKVAKPDPRRKQYGELILPETRYVDIDFSPDYALHTTHQQRITARTDLSAIAFAKIVASMAPVGRLRGPPTAVQPALMDGKVDDKDGQEEAAAIQSRSGSREAAGHRRTSVGTRRSRIGAAAGGEPTPKNQHKSHHRRTQHLSAPTPRHVN